MSEGVVVAIILAAGGATRMGRPKQLLEYRGRSLLMHSVETASEAGCQPIVVLGCEAKAVRQAMEKATRSESVSLENEPGTGILSRRCPVHIAENPAWAEGMGTSIRRGVEAAVSLCHAAEAVLLMLCDQPRVTVDLLRRLIAIHRRDHHAIVACHYGDVVGPPTLFDRRLFGELTKLSGPGGAKTVIEAHRDTTHFVPFPEGRIDIDTPADYARLRNATS